MKKKLLLVFGVLLAAAPFAHADTTFDYTAYQTTLTAGAAAVAAIAGSLAAVAAGVLVWKKIQKYFAKSG